MSIILSIDPGYERLGIAILKKEKGQKEELIFSECFKTLAKEEHPERLKQIGNRIEEIIIQHKPEILAIEGLFFNTNQKTAMKVSEARGTILYLAKNAGLEIFEYTPLQIKTAITGYGRSDKNAVTKMIPALIDIKKEIKYDDEIDAIAVGLTCSAYEKI